MQTMLSDRIVSRETAGLRPRKWGTPLKENLVKRVVVHWLGVPGTVDNPAGTWQGVQRVHMDTKGWSDVAYNFGITRTGEIYEGRGWEFQSGANGRGHNHDAVAICAMVTTEETLTPEFWESLQEVVTKFVAIYRNIDQIVGHRDIGNTTCPGDEIHGNLGQISLEGYTYSKPKPLTDEPEFTGLKEFTPDPNSGANQPPPDYGLQNAIRNIRIASEQIDTENETIHQILKERGLI